MKVHQLDDLLPHLRTGCPVLFAGDGWDSWIIKKVGRSEWSHVGAVLRRPGREPELLEATTLTDLPDLLTGTRIAGVKVVPLRERLRTYRGTFGVRQIFGPEPYNVAPLTEDFLRDFAGRAYEVRRREMLYAVLDLMPWQRNEEDFSTVFCTELVAAFLMRLGYLHSRKPANEYTVRDFGEDFRFRLPVTQRTAISPVLAIARPA